MLLVGVTGVALAATWTDQADYTPGGVVTIFGDNSDEAGYAVGETVHVDVLGPNGYAVACDATADDSGAWSCQVILATASSAVGEYSYTATGQASGVSQSGTFTDSLIGAIFITDSTCTGVDLNIYGSKGDFYISGGPDNGNHYLPDGEYYVKVTEPGGALLGTSIGSADARRS